MAQFKKGDILYYQFTENPANDWKKKKHKFKYISGFGNYISIEVMQDIHRLDGTMWHEKGQLLELESFKFKKVSINHLPEWL